MRDDDSIFDENVPVCCEESIRAVWALNGESLRQERIRRYAAEGGERRLRALLPWSEGFSHLPEIPSGYRGQAAGGSPDSCFTYGDPWHGRRWSRWARHARRDRK